MGASLSIARPGVQPTSVVVRESIQDLLDQDTQGGQFLYVHPQADPGGVAINKRFIVDITDVDVIKAKRQAAMKQAERGNNQAMQNLVDDNRDRLNNFPHGQGHAGKGDDIDL